MWIKKRMIDVARGTGILRHSSTTKALYFAQQFVSQLSRIDSYESVRLSVLARSYPKSKTLDRRVETPNFTEVQRNRSLSDQLRGIAPKLRQVARAWIAFVVPLGGPSSAMWIGWSQTPDGKNLGRFLDRPQIASLQSAMAVGYEHPFRKLINGVLRKNSSDLVCTRGAYHANEISRNRW